MKLPLSILILAGAFMFGTTNTQYGKEKPELKIGKIVPGDDIKPGKPRFPLHWGRPPAIQVRDHVKLPGKFGHGSSTLAKWIAGNLAKDVDKGKPEVQPKPKPKPPVKPVPPIVPLPPVEVKEKLDTYKSTQKELQVGLLEEIKALGKKPSREAVRKTIETFREVNKDVIEAQKALGKDIQDWQKANKPVRPAKPEPSIEVREKLDTLKEKQKELDSVKSEFHEKLKSSKNISKDQRVELIREFREANVDKHKAVKDAQKELQKQIRETKQDGPRRK